MKTKVTIMVNHENWRAHTFIMDTLGTFLHDCNEDSMEGWSMQITDIEELEDEEENTSPKLKMYVTVLEEVIHRTYEVEAPNIVEAMRLFDNQQGTLVDTQVSYNKTDIEELKD